MTSLSGRFLLGIFVGVLVPLNACVSVLLLLLLLSRLLLSGVPGDPGGNPSMRFSLSGPLRVFRSPFPSNRPTGDLSCVSSLELSFPSLRTTKLMQFLTLSISLRASLSDRLSVS